MSALLWGVVGVILLMCDHHLILFLFAVCSAGCMFTCRLISPFLILSIPVLSCSFSETPHLCCYQLCHLSVSGFGDRLLSEVKKLAPKDVKIKVGCGEGTSNEDIHSSVIHDWPCLSDCRKPDHTFKDIASL